MNNWPENNSAFRDDKELWKDAWQEQNLDAVSDSKTAEAVGTRLNDIDITLDEDEKPKEEVGNTSQPWTEQQNTSVKTREQLLKAAEEITFVQLWTRILNEWWKFIPDWTIQLNVWNHRVVFDEVHRKLILDPKKIDWVDQKSVGTERVIQFDKNWKADASQNALLAGILKFLDDVQAQKKIIAEREKAREEDDKTQVGEAKKKIEESAHTSEVIVPTKEESEYSDILKESLCVNVAETLWRKIMNDPSKEKLLWGMNYLVTSWTETIWQLSHPVTWPWYEQNHINTVEATMAKLIMTKFSITMNEDSNTKEVSVWKNNQEIWKLNKIWNDSNEKKLLQEIINKKIDPKIITPENSVTTPVNPEKTVDKTTEVTNNDPRLSIFINIFKNPNDWQWKNKWLYPFGKTEEGTIKTTSVQELCQVLVPEACIWEFFADGKYWTNTKNAVKALQLFLNKNWADIKVDRWFGPETANATMEYIKWLEDKNGEEKGEEKEEYNKEDKKEVKKGEKKKEEKKEDKKEVKKIDKKWEKKGEEKEEKKEVKKEDKKEFIKIPEWKDEFEKKIYSVIKTEVIDWDNGQKKVKIDIQGNSYEIALWKDFSDKSVLQLQLVDSKTNIAHKYELKANVKKWVCTLYLEKIPQDNKESKGEKNNDLSDKEVAYLKTCKECLKTWKFGEITVNERTPLNDQELWILFWSEFQQWNIGDCYLVTALHAVKNMKEFNTLMKWSISKVKYKTSQWTEVKWIAIIMPLWEPWWKTVFINNHDLIWKNQKWNDMWISGWKWFQMLEVAYAKHVLNKPMPWSMTNQKVFHQIDWWLPSNALKTLLWKNNVKTKDFGIDPQNLKQWLWKTLKWTLTKDKHNALKGMILNHDQKEGESIMLASILKQKPKNWQAHDKTYQIWTNKILHHNHAYYITAVEKSDNNKEIKTITVQNPWNGNDSNGIQHRDVIELTWNQFLEWFSLAQVSNMNEKTFLDGKTNKGDAVPIV